MRREADLDTGGTYRYRLARIWAPAKQRAGFVLINPSTADAEIDDPTTKRLVGFCRLWGLGGFEVVNLFAYRTKDPAALKAAHAAGVDVHGPWNTEYLDETAERVDVLFVGWGVHGAFLDEGRRIARRLGGMRTLFCLGRTAEGHPRHPLYLPADTRPERFPVRVRGLEP